MRDSDGERKGKKGQDLAESARKNFVKKNGYRPYKIRVFAMSRLTSNKGLSLHLFSYLCFRSEPRKGAELN